MNKLLISKNAFGLSNIDNNKLLKRISTIIESGYYINGPYVEQFEKKFAKFNKNKFGVGFSSASTGSSTVTNLLTKESDNEVIIPAYAPLPVAMSLKNYGKKIIYADVNKETFLIETSEILKLINKNTKLVIPVHLFGNVMNIKSLLELIPKKIKVIEDASQAHGSKFDNKFAGSEGTAGIFSFYPTKNLGAYGDAGLVTTNSNAMYKELKSYRNYGLTDFNNISKLPGNNFRMDEIQACILLMKIKYLRKWNKQRNENAKKFKEQLKDLPVRFQKIDKLVYSNYHVFIIIVPIKFRNKLYNFLKQNNIEATIYYDKPLPALARDTSSDIYLKDNFPNSFSLSKTNISIPVNHKLNSNQVDIICKTIKEFFKKN